MVVFNKKLLLSLFISLFCCGFGAMKRAVAMRAEQDYRDIFSRVVGILGRYFSAGKKDGEYYDYFLKGLGENLEEQKEKLESIDSKNNLNVDSSSSSSSSSSVDTSADIDFKIFAESQSSRVHALMDVAEAVLGHGYYNYCTFFNSKTLASVLGLERGIDDAEELARELNNVFNSLFSSIAGGEGCYSGMTLLEKAQSLIDRFIRIKTYNNPDDNFALLGLIRQIEMLLEINKKYLFIEEEEEEEEEEEKEKEKEKEDATDNQDNDESNRNKNPKHAPQIRRKVIRSSSDIPADAIIFDYLDAARCTGLDVKKANNAKGVLIVNKRKIDFSSFTQAIMRLRKYLLLDCQTVDIVTSEDATIKDAPEDQNSSENIYADQPEDIADIEPDSLKNYAKSKAENQNENFDALMKIIIANTDKDITNQCIQFVELHNRHIIVSYLESKYKEMCDLLIRENNGGKKKEISTAISEFVKETAQFIMVNENFSILQWETNRTLINVVERCRENFEKVIAQLTEKLTAFDGNYPQFKDLNLVAGINQIKNEGERYLGRIKNNHQVLAFEKNDGGNIGSGERQVAIDMEHDDDAQKQIEKDAEKNIEVAKDIQNSLQMETRIVEGKTNEILKLLQLISKVSVDELSPDSLTFDLPITQTDAYKFFFNVPSKKREKPPDSQKSSPLDGDANTSNEPIFHSQITTLAKNMGNIQETCARIIKCTIKEKEKKEGEEEEEKEKEKKEERNEWKNSLDTLLNFKNLFELNFFSDFYFLDECFHVTKNEVSFFDFICGRPEAMLIVWDPAPSDDVEYYDIDKKLPGVEEESKVTNEGEKEEEKKAKEENPSGEKDAPEKISAMPGYATNGIRDNRVKVIFIPTSQVGNFKQAVQKKFLTNCLLMGCGQNSLDIRIGNWNDADTQTELPPHVSTFIEQRAQWMNSFMCGEIGQLISPNSETTTISLFNLLRMENNEFKVDFYGSEIRKHIHLFLATSAAHFAFNTNEVESYFLRIYTNSILDKNLLVDEALRLYHARLGVSESSTPSEVFRNFAANLYENPSNTYVYSAEIAKVYADYAVAGIDFESEDFRKFAITLEDQIVRIIVGNSDDEKSRILTAISEYVLWNIIREHSYLNKESSIDCSIRHWSMPDVDEEKTEGKTNEEKAEEKKIDGDSAKENAVKVGLTASENAWRIILYVLKDLFADGREAAFDPLQSATHPLSFAAYMCWHLKDANDTVSFEKTFAGLRQTQNEKNCIDCNALMECNYILITKENIDKFPIAEWEDKNVFNDKKYWNAFSWLILRLFNLCEFEELDSAFPQGTKRREMLYFALSQCSLAEENVLRSDEKIEPKKLQWILEKMKECSLGDAIAKGIANIIGNKKPFVPAQEAVGLVYQHQPIRDVLVEKQYLHILKNCETDSIDAYGLIFPDTTTINQFKHIGLVYKLRDYLTLYWNYSNLINAQPEIPKNTPWEKLFALLSKNPCEFIANCTKKQFDCLVNFMGSSNSENKELMISIIDTMVIQSIEVLRLKMSDNQFDLNVVRNFFEILLTALEDPSVAKISPEATAIIFSIPDIAARFMENLAKKINIEVAFRYCEYATNFLVPGKTVLFDLAYPYMDRQIIRQSLENWVENKDGYGNEKARYVMRKIQKINFNDFVNLLYAGNSYELTPIFDFAVLNSILNINRLNDQQLTCALYYYKYLSDERVKEITLTDLWKAIAEFNIGSFSFSGYGSFSQINAAEDFCPISKFYQIFFSSYFETEKCNHESRMEILSIGKGFVLFYAAKYLKPFSEKKANDTEIIQDFYAATFNFFQSLPSNELAFFYRPSLLAPMRLKKKYFSLNFSPMPKIRQIFQQSL
ncbi:MAG: hypothetical protein LBI69_01395 [Puniceicoccales bacterium]|jgi:hypothetical protein|nr:hypothetical protein [Puniceicoccales bacterium]